MNTQKISQRLSMNGFQGQTMFFFSKHLILYRDTETHQDAHAMNIRRIDNISLCCGLYNN